jgi:hypothetical protein
MTVCRRLSLFLSIATAAVGGAAGAQMPPPVAVAPAPAPEAEPALPVRLALHLEGAAGVATGSFKNGLAGGRIDARFSPHVSLGGYLGYANLKGKDGRAHAALTYAQLEYLTGQTGDRVRLPVRFASGYLGGNGPIVRLGAGLALALSPRVDLVTELASMVWFTNNQTLLSLDLALELAFTL